MTKDIRARLLAVTGGVEIGLYVEITGSGDEVISSQTFTSQTQMISYLTIGKIPETEEEELELGKKLELAGSGFWRDIVKEKLDIPGMMEFNSVYAEIALMEIKEKANGK